MKTFEAFVSGSTLEEWVTAAGAAGVTFLIALALRRFIVHRLSKFAARTKTKADDLVVEVLRKTNIGFLAVVGVYAGSQFVTLPAAPLRLLNSLMVVMFFFQAALWGNAVIAFLVGRAVASRLDTDAAGATTLSTLGLVAKGILWSVLFLLVLDNLGVNITGLVAGLGIGGVAVALALQNVLGDLFASLSIALDKPFVVGDFVVIDQLMGNVEHVGLKTTRIRSLSGEQIIMSNTDLLKSRIRNFKRMYERRILFTIGVTYSTPHAKLAAIPAMIRQIIETQEGVRFDRAHFSSYADSSLTFEIVYYVLSPDYNVYMNTQQAVNLAIYSAFEREGIDFAFPTRSIVLENAGDLVRR
jgi:small-conductance mechanosensitive channel